MPGVEEIKYAKIAPVAVAALAGLMLVMLVVGVDATGLGNTALAQLGVDSGMTTSIAGTRFSLRRGLSIQGLSAAAETEFGAMDAQIESSPLLDELSDREGWVTSPVQVTGTLLEPAYRVDMQAVRAQAEGRARDSLIDEAKKRLGRTLGRICCAE